MDTKTLKNAKRSGVQLYEVCKLLLSSASFNSEMKTWNIGPMSDSPDGKMALLRQVVSKIESSK